MTTSSQRWSRWGAACEQFLEAVHIALAQRLEEPRRQFRPLLVARLEPGPALGHVAPRPHHQLTARRLRAPHRRRDLGKAEVEHLPQHEHRPLQRTEPLQQQQGRHRHRVRQLRRPLRVLVGVGEQRLREPRPDVGLTAVTGTRAGAMSTTAGRIRPTAASSSRTPRLFRKPTLTCAVQPPPGAAASFSRGTKVLVTPPARATAASSAAPIHRARFIVHSLSP